MAPKRKRAEEDPAPPTRRKTRSSGPAEVIESNSVATTVKSRATKANNQSAAGVTSAKSRIAKRVNGNKTKGPVAANEVPNNPTDATKSAKREASDSSAPGEGCDSNTVDAGLATSVAATSPNGEKLPVSSQHASPSSPTLSKDTTTDAMVGAQKPPKKGVVSAFPTFSEKQASELFQIYQDTEVTDAEVIGPEGLEKLCNQADLDMSGPKPILLAWMLGCKEMGHITKGEWMSGTSKWQIDTPLRLKMATNDLDDLLFKNTNSTQFPDAGKSKTKTNSKDVEPYNRTLFREYSTEPRGSFRKFYAFTFELAKSDQARNIEMEIATALWSAILAPRYPICSDLIDFINTKKTYKGVNKDLWAMTQEFCEEFQDHSLDTYESDGAWPTLMDDFVSHSIGKNSEVR